MKMRLLCAALALTFSLVSETRADVTATFSATPNPVGVNQPVELTVNLSGAGATIPFPSICNGCFLDVQGGFGDITITDDLTSVFGHVQTFHVSQFGSFGGATVTFETAYAAPGDYIAVYSGSITVGGSILFPDPCEGSPGVTCPRNGTFFVTYELFGGTHVLVTTPLPAALPLFATGLGALGLLGWRRKRKGPPTQC